MFKEGSLSIILIYGSKFNFKAGNGLVCKVAPSNSDFNKEVVLTITGGYELL